jgi:hypothetical protein
MPITTIPIIARTNTIDEWRIQTNASANDLNDLGFYTYDKTQGTLLLSNTSILNITAEGTPLQVANNVLFSKNLTLGNNLLLGVQTSGTGNLIVGSTVGMSAVGLKPIVEVQFADYIWPGLNQLFTEVSRSC